MPGNEHLHELPTPPVPESADLRAFDYMPLEVRRIRDSETAALITGDEFRCAVLLWCACWHSVPAASLVDDDIVLAQLAGFGRVVAAWRKVREGALRGFVKCSDGRLYHLVVAEKAVEAWRARLLQRWRTECARLKKAGQRHGEPVSMPTFEAWTAANFPDSVSFLSPETTSSVPEDIEPCPTGQPPLVLGETASKGREREGKGDLTPTRARGARTATARDWWRSNEGIDGKARELGIAPTQADTYPSLKAKCFERLNARRAP